MGGVVINILVCIKYTEGEGLNPFAGYALEAAARLRDKDPSVRVTAVCLGPEAAVSVLRRALAIAADRAYLLTGFHEEELDHRGVSELLCRGVAALEARVGPIELIFCGRQAPDRDSGQTGPLLAQRLGWPQVTCALEAEADGDRITVRRETCDATEVLSAQLPCLIAFTKPGWEPRLPSVSRSVAAVNAAVPTLTPEDVPGGAQPPLLRFLGRRTVPRRSGLVRIREETDADSARTLFKLLNTTGVI